MKKSPFSKRTTLCNEGAMLIGDSGYDPGGGGDSYMEQTGMLVGNFELNL